MRNDIFGNADKRREEECVKFLESLGYVLIPPIKDKNNINSLDALLEFFYSNMYRHNKDRKLRYAPMSEDRKFLKNFVNDRMKVGVLSRKRALLECARIIEVLFKYEDMFNLKSPITSTVILTQGWIIDRVLSIINGEDLEEEQRFFSMLDEFMDKLID